jgi:uncharacterized Fe-S cluster-containing MiaB family protein
MSEKRTTAELSEEMITAVYQSTIDALKRGSFVNAYTNRVQVPKELVEEVYNSIDHQWVINNLKPRINKLVADRIFSYIRQSVVEDVSSILNDKEVRNSLKLALLDEFRLIGRG